SLLTTVAGLSYTDNSVVNGTTYAYYLKAVYTGGESDPTATVYATPNPVTSVILGNGTLFTGSLEGSPINIWYRSLHGQSVYTAAELNSAGVVGPTEFTELGFYVNTPPNLALPSFTVRMKHTTATNVASWQTATGMVTVYSSNSYMPVAGGYDMLTLDTPFLWNGIDNIVIDTAFDRVSAYSQSGTVQYTSVTSGYRYVRDDYSDQTNVFSGGSISSYRPNVQLTFLVEEPSAPEIVVSHTSMDFGALAAGSISVLPFAIQNIGDAALTGTITTPAGYSIAEESRSAQITRSTLRTAGTDRNTINFTIGAGSEAVFNLTLAPTAVGSYNGNVVINSNDADEPTVNIYVTGSAFIPPTISIDNGTLTTVLTIGETGTDSFTISNVGSQDLTYTLQESPAVDWFSAAPLSGTIIGNASQLATGSFSADGMVPGIYETSLLLDSNDPETPQLIVGVEIQVVNTIPAIALPDSFEFDMNGSLLVDFTPYVDDVDAQALILDYSGNNNVLVSIDGMTVTFTAMSGWYGTEELSFSVYDGYDYAYDTVAVTVNFVNTAPTIVLPDSFEFDMNGSLLVDFTPYVDDVDAQALILDYSGNTNVLVSIDGMAVTFTAMSGWYGTEEIVFSVYDGYAYSYDSVLVTVNLDYLGTPLISQIDRSAYGVTIFWEPVANATEYYVYRAFEPFGDYLFLATTNQTSFEDAEDHSMAFYKVIAVNNPPLK
ncbi:MAG: hypothetical protein K0B87_00750, partial [Candidatus Syntrophosphaera sp.]|nr:hypothetical protein [Candidatus Syntrophosphaera sp.]